jgi:hypothetical protein
MPNPKRPRDPNQRAKLIVDIAVGESDEPKAPPPKDPADPRSPAMAAGVAEHIWSLTEIAALLD